MKKAGYLSWVVLNTFFVSTLGCAEMMAGRTPTTVTHTTPETIQGVQRTWYGAKARVTVMEFEDKTGVDYQVSSSIKGVQVGTPVGRGMKDQMVTALMQTGRFIVLERQNIKDVIGEQDFGASGRIRRETAAPIGDVEGAEFLIYGAVTEYLPGQAGVSGGFGVDPLSGIFGASPGGTLASLAVRTFGAAAFANRDHVAIDIRLVDARTGRVVNATSVEGTPQDFGAALGGIFGSVLLGVSGQVQTPMQKAMRACIIKAVNWVADNCLEHREQSGVRLVSTKETIEQDSPESSGDGSHARKKALPRRGLKSGEKKQKAGTTSTPKSSKDNEWGL